MLGMTVCALATFAGVAAAIRIGFVPVLSVTPPRPARYFGSNWFTQYPRAFAPLGVMLPPQSQLSLPSPSHATLYGAGCQFAARSFSSVVACAAVMYSSQSAASWGEAAPGLSERQ